MVLSNNVHLYDNHDVHDHHDHHHRRSLHILDSDDRLHPYHIHLHDIIFHLFHDFLIHDNEFKSLDMDVYELLYANEVNKVSIVFY